MKKRKISLSKKITSYIFISSIVFSFAVMFFLAVNVLGEFEEQEVLIVREKVERVKESFEKELMTMESTVDGLALQLALMYESNKKDTTKTLNDFEFKTYKLLGNLLRSDIKTSKDVFVYLSPLIDGEVHDVWLTRDDMGRVYRHPEKRKKGDYDNENMEWYYDIDAVSRGEWIDIHYDPNGRPVTSYVVPIYYNGNMVGVVGTYFDLGLASQLLMQMDDGKKAFFWLIDSKDNIVYHPEYRQGTSLKDIDCELYGTNWDVSYSEDNNNGVACRHFVSITSNQWKLIYSMDETFFTKNKVELLEDIGIIYLMLIAVFIIIHAIVMRNYKKRYSIIIETIEQNRLDGRKHPIKLKLSSDAQIVVDTINDNYSEIDRLKAKLHKMTYNNRITGLPNWIQMREDLERLLGNDSQGPICSFDIDMDFFKCVNEIFGHHIGDEILISLGNNLRNIEGDGLRIYHTDGDAFIAIAQACDGKIAAVIAEKIKRAVESVSYDAVYDVNLTCSIGIACYPEHGETSDELLKFAEVALYQAKNKGKNQFCIFEEDMFNQLTSVKELEEDFHRALLAHEFVVHYQPKYSNQHEIIGIEALVRWQHPEKGLLYPGYFIEYAEQTGLIVELGEQVLRQACRDFKGLKTICQSLEHIAVNLSGRQLLEHEFVFSILKILEQESLQYEYLELEITETMMIYDREHSIQKLLALKDEGICISLDDFGSGYASVNNIKELPICRLKIDRLFIEDIEENPKVLNMLKSIVDMSHELDMLVTVEGVETKRQMTMLLDCNVDELQGYYLSKPLPLAELRKKILE